MVRTAPPSVLLIDFDGTVADSIELILAAYRHTFVVHRGAALPDRLWLEGVGTPLLSQLEDLAESPAEVPRLLETYRSYAISEHDRLIRGFPTMKETLLAIRAAGVPMGVVSSKNQIGIARGLRALSLEGIFATVVGSGDTPEHKPHPAPVFLALEQLAARPEEALFVGDSLHDLEAGRRAGVRTGAALWGPFDREHLGPGNPDLWLERPSELLTALGIE